MVDLNDRELYARVSQEIGNGNMDSGLWTKAFADSRGRNDEAKALYLKMRVLDLKQQASAQSSVLRIEAKN